MFLLAVFAMEKAEAHSFKVGFIIPLSGAEVAKGNDALDAMLLAADERDRHPGNESDGHLGGLDVYILKIDSNRDQTAILDEIGQLVETSDIQIFSGLITPVRH